MKHIIGNKQVEIEDLSAEEEASDEEQVKENG